MTKVTLATPPYSSEADITRLGPLMPLGLAYIGAVLQQSGHEVAVVDSTASSLDIQATIKAILSQNPGIVGLTSYTSTIPLVYEVARGLKAERKDVQVALGGPHASALPFQTLRECETLDAVIVGEGEYVFRDYVQGKKSIGLVWRDKREIHGDPEPAYVKQLDSLPFPARSLFNLERYKALSEKYCDAKKRPVATALTSRGCPGACVFCCKVASGGRRFRSRSPENVVQELVVIEEQGFKEVMIQDDCFTFDRERVLQICRLVKEQDLNLRYSLPNGIRVDRADKEMLEAMYDAGFYSIHFGVESGDDGVLRTIRKGTTVRLARKTILTAKKIGYYIGTYVIVGLPGSTVHSEEKTLELLKELNPDFVGVGMCIPYPGTPMWTTSEATLERHPWNEFSHATATKPLYIPEGMTAEQVIYYHDEILRSFYLRPVYWTKAFLKDPIWSLRRARVLVSIALRRGWI